MQQASSLHSADPQINGATRRWCVAPVDMTDGMSDARLSVRDEAMHKLAVSTTRDMWAVITAIFLPVRRCRRMFLPGRPGSTCQSIS